MTNGQLIRKLMNYPANAKVILSEELGASELEMSQVKFEEWNYVEYDYNGRPMYNWESPPNEYNRKIIQTEEVVVISWI